MTFYILKCAPVAAKKCYLLQSCPLKIDQEENNKPFQHILNYVGISYLTACRGEFNVSGRIDIERKASQSIDRLKSRNFKVGDVVNFSFVLNFTGTQDVTFIDVLISGSSMKQIRPSDDRSFAIITLRNNKVPLKSAFGTFVMKVNDIINIRSILEVRPSSGTASMIYSESIPVFVPSFNVTHTFPEKIKMREKTSFNADITLPLFGVNNAYAKLYMPYNDNEAKITIADFAISGISGVGIGATDILNSRLNSGITKFSRSMTSEEDTATITFPTLNITDGDNDVIMLTLLCQGILQDFMGYSDGHNMEMGIGFKLNEDFIWIGSTNASIDDDTDVRNQRPVLLSELTEFQRSIHDGTCINKSCKARITTDSDGMTIVKTLNEHKYVADYYKPEAKRLRVRSRKQSGDISSRQAKNVRTELQGMQENSLQTRDLKNASLAVYMERRKDTLILSQVHDYQNK
ncbi:unnamed protein product [Mytilus coruscus]|uniref:Uncharacterized protein n=1 Tax=Mytilus coruscus TaxID=42192 RepID=A0A6J8DMC9_MYTCO|nr:unnamed protein product [Mytilus coruscus]